MIKHGSVVKLTLDDLKECKKDPDQFFNILEKIKTHLAPPMEYESKYEREYKQFIEDIDSNSLWEP